MTPRKVEPIELPLFKDEVARRDDPSAWLSLVLAYNGSAPRGAIEAAVGGVSLDVLLRAGIIRASGETVRSPFRTTLFGTVLVVGDKPLEERDAVMGAGPSTEELARVIPEDTFGLRVLDVGAGAGTLALLAAARGADAVVATDVNPRACAITALNARLNGLAVDVRLGPLFQPVRDERFDLVVAQPPFLCLPEGVPASTYLHGGEYGDELAMAVIEKIGDALEDGGIGALRFDSPVRDPPLVERARALADLTCGMAVFESPGPSPADAAITYAAAGNPDLGPAFTSRALDYYRHLRDLGIEEITAALVLVRRQPGAIGMFSVQTAGGIPGRPRLDRFLAGVDLTAEGRRTELLHTRISAAPGAELVTALPLAQPEIPQWALRLPDDSISEGASLNRAGLILFQLFAQGRMVSAAIEEYARLTGAGVHQGTGEVLQFVIDGLSHGALVQSGA